MSISRFATRLNSFGSSPQAFWPDLKGKPSTMQMAERAATAKGLTDLDLNFPDHVSGDPKAIGTRVGDLGLSINGLAMRYYTNPAFKLGAFTNPDKSVRQEAIDLTKQGIDAARAMGSNLMTIWLGQDGFDAPPRSNTVSPPLPPVSPGFERHNEHMNAAPGEQQYAAVPIPGAYTPLASPSYPPPQQQQQQHGFNFGSDAAR